MTGKPDIAILLVAGGRGSRIGGDTPKQYRRIAGRMVLSHAIERAGAGGHAGRIMTVIHPDDTEPYAACARESGVAEQRLASTHGGATRQDSVRNGLEALARGGFASDGIVLIHDAARPFLDEAIMLRAVFAAMETGAAIPVLPVADTLATLDGGGFLAENPDRAALRAVQTPQAFRFGPILAAHRAAEAAGRTDFTDDASLARAHGMRVLSYPGAPDLFKITVEADLARAAALLEVPARPEEPATHRTGLGFDVHAFTEGSAVILGGVAIPHDRALLGHSDADPLLHAMTDALLGTIGSGDIGTHFPPSDPRWKGVASRVFLAEAVRLVREAGGEIVNIDGTIIAEAPKVGPHRAGMQAVIGEVTGLPANRIGIKATTSERLGFTGRREGIAAFAVASVRFTR